MSERTKAPEPWTKERVGKTAGNALITLLAIYGWVQFCEEVLFKHLF